MHTFGPAIVPNEPYTPASAARAAEAGAEVGFIRKKLLGRKYVLQISLGIPGRTRSHGGSRLWSPNCEAVEGRLGWNCLQQEDEHMTNLVSFRRRLRRREWQRQSTRRQPRIGHCLTLVKARPLVTGTREAPPGPLSGFRSGRILGEGPGLTVGTCH